MIVEEITIRKLAPVIASRTPSGSVRVSTSFVGRNEAGKSTLFEAFTRVLFRPAYLTS